MAIWTIELVNDTGSAKDFFVYSEPPKVRFSGQAVAVHPCAWITYPGVQPGDRRRSTFSESIAIFVDFRAKPAPGVVLTENANVPVDARARDRVDLLNDPALFGPVEHDQSDYGTVSLHTPDPLSDGSFPPPATIGLGKYGDSDLPYPIAGFPPQAGGVFVIEPSHRFHLAQGSPLRGEALALHPPSLVAIDFDQDKLTATIVAKADGTFAVTYEPV
ncbi:hypothetical protein [Caulobacter endophyticus]|uniref:Uncharacterized protein n=1 Tax=Caulobacter endophyticus TaxID=2172652 RepID=A0A2T9JHX1_9CAUL|nr:hypothetical protein [Caulobacter endophyticus]PVM83293.1 hypothetical protein DDF67_21490 [Caulobacter endophyticus]